MNNLFNILSSGEVQRIPDLLDNTNVNDTQSGLNIFKKFCSLIPQQQDLCVKVILEGIAVNILNKMISLPNTNWNQQDTRGENIYDWALYSGSSEIMKIFHDNQEFFQNKNLSYSSATFVNNLLAPHISSEFRTEQIEKIPATLQPRAFIDFCNSIPLQQQEADKNTLGNCATTILDKMISLPNTDWNQKDSNNNTILEWAIWSTSTTAMNRLHQNKELIQQLIGIEKASGFQIFNFWRVMMQSHIPNDFREKQITEFKAKGFNIDDKSIDGLNGFEYLCKLIPLQQQEADKNTLENFATTILNKMILTSEINWDQKDASNNTLLEWALWSASSKIMEILYKNPGVINKLIDLEKASAIQNHNFWRVLAENHIPDDFRKAQIEKFKLLGLDINNAAADGHTPLYTWLHYLLNNYIAKYNGIVKGENDNTINMYQSGIDKFNKIIENLIKFGANPAIEAGNILSLLCDGSSKVSKLISTISDEGKKTLAEANLKTCKFEIFKLVNLTISKNNFNWDQSNKIFTAPIIKSLIELPHSKELLEKIVEKQSNIKDSVVGNNIIAIMGNKMWAIKQEISKAQDAKQKVGLTKIFKEFKNQAELVIKNIVKQVNFNPDVEDGLGSTAIAWLGEFGSVFLKECIGNMHIKPDANLLDKVGKSALHYYSDYNAKETVEELIKNAKGNVNTQDAQTAATPAHLLILNPSGINSAKEKLPTLKILLSKENKPPFDPAIKMVGNKSVADLIKETILVTGTGDLQNCQTELNNYTEWYSNKEVIALGQEMKNLELDLYA